MRQPSPPTPLSPVIVLVAPQLGENIGTAARAMANFGLADLRLVNPREGWPNKKAHAAASGADGVIDEVRTFRSAAEAVADLGFVYATTARAREVAKPVAGPREAATRVRALAAAGSQAGVMFGPERCRPHQRGPVARRRDPDVSGRSGFPVAQPCPGRAALRLRMAARRLRAGGAASCRLPTGGRIRRRRRT